MQLNDFRSKFGAVSKCSSPDDVVTTLKEISCSDFRGRASAAALYMVLTAHALSRPNTYYEDALSFLNALSNAKTQFDIVNSHEIGMARVTASILLASQAFVDETTVPCTEWASTEEIFEVVLDEALKHA